MRFLPESNCAARGSDFQIPVLQTVDNGIQVLLIIVTAQSWSHRFSVKKRDGFVCTCEVEDDVPGPFA